MADDTIALLQRALDQMSAVVAAVRPEQLGLPTPCADWSVADLLRHVVVQDLRNFAVAARGETADWGASAEALDDNWAAACRHGAHAVLDAWRTADLDASVPMMGGRSAPLRSRADMQIAELAVHAWDIDRSTNRSADLDDEVAQHGLDWSRQMLRPEFRGPDKAFGDEVPVAPTAPVYDRLAGWFGRDPAWTPTRT